MARTNYFIIALATLILACSGSDDDNNSKLSSSKEPSITIDSSNEENTNDVNTPSESSNEENVIIPNDFVIGFNFNNDVTDLSSNNHIGKLQNLSYALGRKGNTNASAVFSSNLKSYIEIPHSKAISLGKEMTLSIWFYYQKQDNNDFYTIIEKSNPNDGGHSRYGMWTHRSGNILICIEPDSCPESLCQECLDSNEKLIENTWNHLVGVFNGTQLILYLNGKENALKTINRSGISQTNFELFFGTDKYGESKFLNGKLDDFKLYDRALSKAEITSLFLE